LRDFEACMAGAALVKPDMGHLETWPDLYISGKTYIPFRWDLSDVAEVVARARDDVAGSMEVAARAQQLYRSAVASDEGDRAFVDRFVALMRAARPDQS
jgi:hypothetical protein